MARVRLKREPPPEQAHPLWGGRQQTDPPLTDEAREGYALLGAMAVRRQRELEQRLAAEQAAKLEAARAFEAEVARRRYEAKP